MGAVIDVVEDVGNFITDEIIEPVVDTVETIVENPVALASVALSIAAPGVGTAIGSALGASGAAATAIGNAVIGGALSEASGGDFVKGALTSGAGSLLGGVVNPAVTEAVGSQAIGQALTGGAIAELQGGDFLQGALGGAVSGGFSDARNAAIDEYLNSIEPGTSYSADLPTEADVLAAMGVSPEVSLSDYPVQDFGIDLGTIDTNTEFYTNPDATAYYHNPDNTNTYTWDDGSSITIDAAGEITGYQPSFDLASSGAAEAATKDISGKLAALDIGKTLSMAALTGILANTKASGGDGSGQTFFEMVPIPADWKSPEYNMAFTPSAPINFGSPELLKGTQWEQPVNLSNLINTLNQPVISPETQQLMTQFQAPATPYQMGINDIIGNLGGQPVSISDIISGIQSGQTYPSTMG